MAEETEREPQALFATPQAAPGVWVADTDVFETLPDGRVIQHAVKGAGYPVGQAAQIRGIAGPNETKETTKRETSAPVSDAADEPPVPQGAERAPEPKKAGK